MRAVDVIIKKREKQELTREEIEFFVNGYTSGEIPDYQAAAWAMAVVLNSMTLREITDLTLAMAFSGVNLCVEPSIWLLKVTPSSSTFRFLANEKT